MRRRSKALTVLVVLLTSTLTSGCLGLAIQRETMESWREPPSTFPFQTLYSWVHTFESSGIEAAEPYQREELIQFDESVTELVINFRAQFPWSSQIEDVIGNETNEFRYVEVRLWEPGVKETGGNPYWEVRATQDYPQTDFKLGNGTFIEGNWLFEIEARGYGITAPIEQLSFHDSFDVYLTITRPCVQFAEVHGEGECTFLSDLE
ncbi:MAG: hypothetical protein VX184_02160 [Candidatus Thermoplasmatota archaeon]|nr:hypothetical protein [Candidatus Thermoplasmatota archaeon]MEC9001638.1 hypothetical protein [Candidatus Thermoplasmatota archaeon]MEE3315629.1 hypothetical protein [Candidatus Thermoplasmatota archaeon]